MVLEPPKLCYDSLESRTHYYCGHACRSECYSQFIEVLGAQLKPQQTSSGVSSTSTMCT